jgi:hypothetical protein
MRYGVVVEELAVEVMAQLLNDRARQEVMALVEVARDDALHRHHSQAVECRIRDRARALPARGCVADPFCRTGVGGTD